MTRPPLTAIAMVLLCLSSCSGSTSTGGSGAGACTSGERQECSCGGRAAGWAECTAGLRFGDCVCATDDAGADPVCGDYVCNGAETCNTCVFDCGACPKCNYAPSCEDALGVPATVLSRADLDVGRGMSTVTNDGGAPAGACEPAQLRTRIRKIHTDKGGGILYCVISASDGLTSEVVITTKTKSLSDGEDFYFDPSVGIFWGQKHLQPTRNNLTVTYNCFIVKSDAWAKVLQAASDAAVKAGGIAGPYGWAFGLGAVAASVAAAAIQASSGDILQLNASQTIDKSNLLDLTNGRAWTVQQNGGSLFSRWDWTLTIESWGCADGRPAPM